MIKSGFAQVKMARARGTVMDELQTPDECVLLVIDIQEKLLAVIHDRQKVLDNTVKLVKFANIMGVPVLLTEQEKLGPTVGAVAAELPSHRAITKIEFDALERAELVDQLEHLSRSTVILAGIESHICVTQTALHLLAEGYRVHVAGDAVSSRSPQDRSVALERMRQAGAVVSSTEMVIYELLGKAGTDEFREVLRLVK
jgi:nicotinamidase-related amidase